jgi:hypothetical protein
MAPVEAFLRGTGRRVKLSRLPKVGQSVDHTAAPLPPVSPGEVLAGTLGDADRR